MIKDRLLNLPNEIESLKIELLNRTQDLEEIKTNMKIWELTEMNEISNAVDDKGKSIFSNDVKRQAELQNRKNDSEQYEDYFYTSKALERNISEANIKLEKLFNEQGNLRAICRLEGENR